MSLNEDARRSSGGAGNENQDADARLVELTELRATRLGFPFVDVRKVQPSQEALDSVPARVAREYGLLPLERKSDHLLVAVSEPLLPEQSDRLRFTLDCPVRTVLAVKEHLLKAIAKWYGEEKDAQEAESPSTGEGKESEKGAVEFIQVEPEESQAATEVVIDPDSPEVTRAIQTIVGEGIRLGASRVALVSYHGVTKVGFRVEDGICSRNDLPGELLAPIAARLIGMTNFYGTIKVVVRGTERRLKASCRTTPYGLALVIEFDKDESAIQAARERASLLSYPFTELEKPQIPADVLATIPRDIARTYYVLPLSVTNDVVAIAMAEPPGPQLQDELRFALGRPFQVMLAPEGRLRAAIERFYGPAEPEAVTVLLAELARPMTTAEVAGRLATWERPSPPQGHPAEAIFGYLRQMATEKLLELFEDIRRRPKLCIRSSKRWQLEVVIPRADLFSVLPQAYRSYLENRLWLVREAIIARIFNIIVRHPEARHLAIAYALYVAACRLAEGERNVPIDPVMLIDEWFNFLYCYALKTNPKIETNAALLNYLSNQSEELVRSIVGVTRDPSLVQNIELAPRWLEALAQQTLVQDVIDETCGTAEAMLNLFVAEARHYRASHMLLLPHPEYLEVAYRIQNRILSTVRVPACWFLPILSRLLANLVNHSEWQVTVAGKTIQAQVRLHVAAEGLAALIEFMADSRQVEVAQMLAASTDCRFVRLHDVQVPEDILKLVDGGVARHLCVLPIATDGETIILAVSQPPSSRHMQELQILLARPIQAVIAPEDELLAAIYRSYPPPYRYEPSAAARYFFQRYTGLLNPVT
ncbi:MAG TPA: hypothetical protein PLD05_02870 [Thermogutta sp.]|nr:hypothetical protein [Thermogutta sp.]